MTFYDFVQKGNYAHDFRYNYGFVEYVDLKTEVCIVCLRHGEFWQKPYKHLYSNGPGSPPQGCPACAREHAGDSTRYTNLSFVEAARSVHGDKFDYSLVEYVNNDVPVYIICPEHGRTSQRPRQHLTSKYGCRFCAAKHAVKIWRIGSKEIGTLYLVKFKNDQEEFLKVGVTTKDDVAKRFSEMERHYNFQILHSVKGSVGKVFSLESDILEQFSPSQYRPSHHFGGHTECIDMSRFLDLCELFDGLQ